MALKILIVDRDKAALQRLSAALKALGFDIIGAATPARAFALAKKARPTMILLSLGESYANARRGLDGEKMCEGLKGDKATAGIPILVMTPVIEEDYFYLVFGADAVIGYDRYPSIDKIEGHCHLLMHRFYIPEEITLGKFRIDKRTRTVHYGQRSSSRFRPKEFDLLYYLMDHPGKVIPKAKLYEQIWRIKLPLGTKRMLRTVDQHILRLRRALKREFKVNDMIATQPAIGYSIARSS